MHRLLAAFVLLLPLALPAYADTSVIISGGGFSFLSGSGKLKHFHGHGDHWRKRHQLGGGHFFHRLPRHERLLLASPHPGSWMQRHKLGPWDHGHKRHWKQPLAPHVIIVIPVPFDSRIKIVTVPGQPHFGTFFDGRTGRHRLVLLPPLKPGRLALAD
jgi:hypothetical protein